jgi:ABC-type lipoprotein release transport system permease subunit
LLDLVELQGPALSWILALVGAVIGVVLTLVLFEWALIVLSSLAGAGVIVQTLDLRRLVTVVAFLILVAIGIAIQASLLAREERAPVET